MAKCGVFKGFLLPRLPLNQNLTTPVLGSDAWQPPSDQAFPPKPQEKSFDLNTPITKG